MRDFLKHGGAAAAVYTSGESRSPGTRRVIPVIVAYMMMTAALLPFARLEGPEWPGLTPFFVAGVLTTEISTCFLLFAWFRNARTVSLLVLASTYLFSALSLLLYLVTFPGGLLPGSALFGTAQTAGWAFVLWKCGFATFSCAAIVLEIWFRAVRIAPERSAAAVWIAVGCVSLAALGVLAMSVLWVDRLPALVDGVRFTPANQAINMFGGAVTVTAIALVLLFVRDRGTLFPWFAVALTVMSSANVLATAGGGRYTVGWTAARLCWFTAGSVLFMFFLHQFVRQQRLLAETSQTLEAAVNARTDDLRHAVQQRDLLLREVYHRVKNNLQVVDSLVAMEARRLSDRAAREALGGLRNRVFALGLVHQQLMSAKDMETFSIAPFLVELCDNILASVGPAERHIRIDVDAEPVMVNLDHAIPIGLLTTELLTNAIRHAQATAITVAFCRCAMDSAALQVSDNGYDPDTGGLPVAGHTGTGARIIEGLTHQLDGQMEIERHNGLSVKVLFPLPEVA